MEDTILDILRIVKKVSFGKWPENELLPGVVTWEERFTGRRYNNCKCTSRILPNVFLEHLEYLPVRPE